MISCKSIGKKGRFGNQIFQFCSGLGVSRKLGFDFKIPNSNHRLQECFNIPERFLLEEIKTIYEYKETRIGYDPQIYKIKDHTDIYGWFQSYKYFEEIKEELFEILSFREHLENQANKIWQDLNIKNPTVSVHVRRGDYVGNPTHRTCEKEYYESAKKIFPEHNFLIFSDDINWCKENMSENVISSGHDLVDFILMSKCDNHIIANSTFSWWAAYLSKSKNKTVVAPKKWFGQYAFPSVYCEDWIVL